MISVREVLAGTTIREDTVREILTGSKMEEDIDKKYSRITTLSLLSVYWCKIRT